MLFGYPPFERKGTHNTQRFWSKVINEEVKFPKDVYVSKNAKDLIRALLACFVGSIADSGILFVRADSLAKSTCALRAIVGSRLHRDLAIIF